MGMRAKAMRWLVRRAVREGHLAWVDRQGRVVDLGEYQRDELEGLVWAVGVAYRTTRERSERSRLGRVRLAAGRLLEALRRAGE